MILLDESFLDCVRRFEDCNRELPFQRIMGSKVWSALEKKYGKREVGELILLINKRMRGN